MSAPTAAAPPTGPPGPSGMPVNPLLAGPFVDTRSGPIPQRAALLVGPVTTFYILAIAAIALRVYSRKLKKQSLRLGDYAIFVAAVFATAYLAICWLVVERGGVGYPLVNVRLSERRLTQQSFIVAWLIQGWANTFVRISILDFFHQVFAVRNFRRVVHVFHGITVAYLIGCTITFFAICRPIKYNWEIGPQALQHCGNLNMKFLLSSIFNLILDFSILILPMPMLWTLQLNSKKKIALTFVFGLGIFVVFATAWRTYHVVEFSTPAARMNFTMTITEDALWSGLEITLGVINACLPIMPPALSVIFKVPFMRLLSLTRLGTDKSKNTGQSGPGHSGTPFFRRLRSRDDASSANSNMASKDRRIFQEYSIDIESESMEMSNPVGHDTSNSWAAHNPDGPLSTHAARR